MNGRDPGLQPERTALAWTRTGLAMMVNSVLVLRAGAIAQDATMFAGALLLSMASVWFIFLARRRRRELQRGQPAVAGARLMLFASASTVFAVGCGCWTILR